MSQFKVIKGKFHVKSYQPDGDSIRFKADDEANWTFFANADRDKKSN